MFGYPIEYLLGAYLGSIPVIYLASLLFRYCLLGRGVSVRGKVGTTMLSGLVAVGFSGFGDGVGDFVSRIANPANMVQLTAYPLAAAIISFFIILNSNGSVDPVPSKRASIILRGISAIFVFPLTFVGLLNLGYSVYHYSLERNEAPSFQSGTSKFQMREIMTEGELGPFWSLVAELDPTGFEYIVERMVALEPTWASKEQARISLEEEIIAYRQGLSLYGPALSDLQRQEIIRSSLALLGAARDRPAVCADLALTGGRNLDRKQLASVGDELNENLVSMALNLLIAKENSFSGGSMPVPATAQDYEKLWAYLGQKGMTDDQINALALSEATNPDFCDLAISFTEGLLEMKGPAGLAIRYSSVQQMMVISP